MECTHPSSSTAEAAESFRRPGPAYSLPVLPQRQRRQAPQAFSHISCRNELRVLTHFRNSGSSSQALQAGHLIRLSSRYIFMSRFVFSLNPRCIGGQLCLCQFPCIYDSDQFINCGSNKIYLRIRQMRMVRNLKRSFDRAKCIGILLRGLVKSRRVGQKTAASVHAPAEQLPL